MGGSHCAVHGCPCTNAKCKGLSFFRITKLGGKSDERSLEWRRQLLTACRRMPPFNGEKAFICSRHFTDDCLITAGKTIRLKLFSLPTQYLPESTIETPKAPPRKQPAERPPPDEKVRVHYYTLDEVRRDVERIVTFPWVKVSDTQDIVLGKLSNNNLIISITISTDLSATVDVRGKTVSCESVETAGLRDVLRRVDNLSLCPGIDEGTCSTPGASGTQWVKEMGQGSASWIIRSRYCDQLSRAVSESEEPRLCSNCKDVQRQLQKTIQKPVTTLHPNAPLSKLKNKNLLVQEVLELRKREKNLTAELKKVQHQLEINSVRVSEDLNTELLNFYEHIPDGHMDEFVKLFWQEQKKAFSCKTKGMRWHPMLIKFGIFVRQISPALYGTLRQMGVVRLPGESTLRDYTGVITTKPGFQEHVLLDLKEQASKLPESQHYVCLMHDEMMIRDDLVFDRKGQELIGYVSAEQLDLSKSLDDNVADHILMFMVVGVTSSIKASIAYFGTRGAAKSDALLYYMWESVDYLETVCDLKVIASTSDKAAPNMKMYSLHTGLDTGADPESGIVHKTVNIYAPDRFIYFVSDPPHLLKTLRNNLYESHVSSSGKRILKCNGLDMVWDHLRKLWEQDIQGHLYKTKLSYDHIFLTPQSKMKVKLAAQVMSESVSKILLEYGEPDVAETARFILLVDKFFDCMNVRHHDEARQTLKPFRKPYTTEDDERFEWLKSVFLRYIRDWKADVTSAPGKASERNKMFLSDPTYKGLIMTVCSVTEATQYILGQGAQFVYTQKFCQDPLEEAFGQHRAMGRRADTMTMHKFGKQERALFLQGSVKDQLKPYHGNVTKRNAESVKISKEPMPKIKRSRKLKNVSVVKEC